jgi:hypothetical protein
MEDATTPRRTRRARIVRLCWTAAAMLGALAGLALFWLHLTTDPLADIRAYYDAATRLNEGRPLYPPDQNVNDNTAYFYPPLFAILFRPLALLPFPVAAAIWAVIVASSFFATLYLLGLRRWATWIAVGILGVPIAWALAIAQAQAVVTLLLTIGSPVAVAFAGHLKLFPILVAVWWVGRRDWCALGKLAAWTAALLLVQLVLEPQATIDFVAAARPGWVGEVRSLSPFAISPVLWAALLVVGIVLALRLAPTRWGWAAAVTLSVLAPPRLLSYMLMTFLAALRREERPDNPRRCA